jgi:3-oxoacid CoA-transferase subunit A
MIYITGDMHGDFTRIYALCDKYATTTDDVLIILGDAGINYYDGSNLERIKRKLAKLPITLFCIHGNHEKRPYTIEGYEETLWNGGIVYRQEKYPNLLFAKDGEVFTLDGMRCITLGGAYSVDKYYRLDRGLGWWEDEQPSDEIKVQVADSLERIGFDVDLVLSHTCPAKYIPTETFLPFIDQSTVDNSTEEWLDGIEEKLSYKRWYCGHYHTSKVIDDMIFMYEDVRVFPVDV